LVRCLCRRRRHRPIAMPPPIKRHVELITATITMAWMACGLSPDGESARSAAMLASYPVDQRSDGASVDTYFEQPGGSRLHGGRKAFYLGQNGLAQRRRPGTGFSNGRGFGAACWVPETRTRSGMNRHPDQVRSWPMVRRAPPAAFLPCWTEHASRKPESRRTHTKIQRPLLLHV
jgi:hypothetical protein